MQFLLKICVLSIIIKCTVSELKCLSSNKNVDKCQDWKKMSVLVADLVGRSIVNDKVETKSNMLTMLIRAASGVIGHGTNALKTLIVNGLVLLTKTVSYCYALWNDNSVWLFCTNINIHIICIFYNLYLDFNGF